MPARNRSQSVSVMEPRKILILSGTNRPTSSTIQIARVVERQYAKIDVATDFYDLRDLPAELFRPESYAAKRASFLPVQQRVLTPAGFIWSRRNATDRFPAS